MAADRGRRVRAPARRLRRRHGSDDPRARSTARAVATDQSCARNDISCRHFTRSNTTRRQTLELPFRVEGQSRDRRTTGSFTGTNSVSGTSKHVFRANNEPPRTTTRSRCAVHRGIRYRRALLSNQCDGGRPHHAETRYGNTIELRLATGMAATLAVASLALATIVTAEHRENGRLVGTWRRALRPLHRLSKRRSRVIGMTMATGNSGSGPGATPCTSRTSASPD